MIDHTKIWTFLVDVCWFLNTKDSLLKEHIFNKVSIVALCKNIIGDIQDKYLWDLLAKVSVVAPIKSICCITQYKYLW